MSTEARKTIAWAGPALRISANVMPAVSESSCEAGQPAAAKRLTTASTAPSGASAVAPRTAASTTGACLGRASGRPNAVRSAAMAQIRGQRARARANVSVLP